MTEPNFPKDLRPHVIHKEIDKFKLLQQRQPTAVLMNPDDANGYTSVTCEDVKHYATRLKIYRCIDIEQGDFLLI